MKTRRSNLIILTSHLCAHTNTAAGVMVSRWLFQHCIQMIPELPLSDEESLKEPVKAYSNPMASVWYCGHLIVYAERKSKYFRGGTVTVKINGLHVFSVFYLRMMLKFRSITRKSSTCQVTPNVYSAVKIGGFCTNFIKHKAIDYMPVVKLEYSEEPECFYFKGVPILYVWPHGTGIQPKFPLSPSYCSTTDIPGVLKRTYPGIQFGAGTSFELSSQVATEKPHML